MAVLVAEGKTTTEMDAFVAEQKKLYAAITQPGGAVVTTATTASSSTVDKPSETKQSLAVKQEPSEDPAGTEGTTTAVETEEPWVIDVAGGSRSEAPSSEKKPPAVVWPAKSGRMADSASAVLSRPSLAVRRRQTSGCQRQAPLMWDPKHELRLSAKYSYLAGAPVRGAAASDQQQQQQQQPPDGRTETERLLAQSNARTEQEMRGGRARDHGRQPPQAARADRSRSPIRPLPEQKRKRKLAATSRGDEFRPASSAEAPARDAPLAPASSGSSSKRKKKEEPEPSRRDERESSKKQKQVHLSVRDPSPEVADDGPSESERGDDAEGEEESPLTSLRSLRRLRRRLAPLGRWTMSCGWLRSICAACLSTWTGSRAAIAARRPCSALNICRSISGEHSSLRIQSPHSLSHLGICSGCWPCVSHGESPLPTPWLSDDASLEFTQVLSPWCSALAPLD